MNSPNKASVSDNHSISSTVPISNNNAPTNNNTDSNASVERNIFSRSWDNLKKGFNNGRRFISKGWDNFKKNFNHFTKNYPNQWKFIKWLAIPASIAAIVISTAGVGAIANAVFIPTALLASHPLLISIGIFVGTTALYSGIVIATNKALAYKQSKNKEEPTIELHSVTQTTANVISSVDNAVKNAPNTANTLNNNEKDDNKIQAANANIAKSSSPIKNNRPSSSSISSRKSSTERKSATAFPSVQPTIDTFERKATKEEKSEEKSQEQLPTKNLISPKK